MHVNMPVRQFAVKALPKDAWVLIQ